MDRVIRELDQLREDVRQTSLGGFPMLIAAAFAWVVCSVLTYFYPPRVTSLIFFFQGMILMPFGLWLLPKWLGLSALPRSHALTPLVVQCAAVQSLMLPAIIAVYSTQPQLVPMAFAAVMGGHLLPYWWIQRSKAYLWGSIATAIGPWILTLFGGISNSYHLTGFYVGIALTVLSVTVRSQVLREVVN